MLLSIGLFIVRLVVGLTFAAHGAQKLFGWYGGHGLKGTGGFFDSIGLKPGLLLATLVGLAEFGGGLMFAAGFATPFAGAFLAIVMIGSFRLHWNNGFFNNSNGYEFNLTLLAVAIAVAFTGAGDLSFDAILFR